MVDRAHPELSVARQCQLLGISRTSVYRRNRARRSQDREMMDLLDRKYLACPFYGSRAIDAPALPDGHSPPDRRRPVASRLGALQQVGVQIGRILLDRLAVHPGRPALAGLPARFRQPNVVDVMGQCR